MKRLHEKVIMITGATGGLGQTVISVFSKTGAKLIVVGRQVPKELPEGMLGFSANVTDEADVKRLRTEVMQKTTRIDCLINLVGGFALGRVIETEASVWSRMLSLNLMAAFLLSREMVPPMVEQGSGRIIHMAARAAVEPFPGAGAYIVSKSGLLALVKVLALELAGSGVTVNGVLPSTIDTPANRQSMPDADFGQWVKPESIAEVLLFLASDASNGVNGSLVPVGLN